MQGRLEFLHRRPPQNYEEENENQKFDEFVGNDVGLFASSEYDHEDKEADALWEEIEKRMDSRRKDRRGWIRVKEEIEKYRNSNPIMTEEFISLKRRLRTMSTEDWDSIPEIGDYSNKKKRRFESFVPVPDTLVEKARQEKEHVCTLDPKSLAAGGAETPWAQTPTTDLTAVGEGRGTVLSLKLDRLSESFSWLTVVDPKGYLTDPNSMKITRGAEVSDINKALLLLKLDFENNKHERGRRILEKARERGGTGKVWMKSAIVERELGNTVEERILLEEGLKRFPSFYKLWLMLGQLEERLGNMEQAKGTYELGLKDCPNCIPMWLSLAHLEEKVNGFSKARAVLAMSRKINMQNSELWLVAVRAEARHGFKKESEILMAKALQECPTSGILWAASIEMVPWPQQKTKSRDAYKRCGGNPHVLAAVGKIFWHDRKFDKARSWFNMVVMLAPDIGDFWALYYKFEMQHGMDENQKDVLKRCVAAEPKHGEKWQSISKAVENLHLPTEVILKKVVSAMEEEELHTAAEYVQN